MGEQRVGSRRGSMDGLAALMAERLSIGAGEVLELLERLPYGETLGNATPEVWQRPEARRVLEQYAARKRAVARLAAQGLL